MRFGKTVGVLKARQVLFKAFLVLIRPFVDKNTLFNLCIECCVNW